MPLLEISGLTKRFGGLLALSGLDVAVESGVIAALIGPNGAGKTTLFNILTGLYRPDKGEVRFAGRSVVGLAPHEIFRAGIGRTFQNIRLFRQMSVLENVLVGLHTQVERGLFSVLLKTQRWRESEHEAWMRAMDLIRRVGLEGEEALPAEHLSYGEQRRLELARALASKPRLLLLDEPTAGMNASESQSLMTLLRRLVGESVETILIIEHNMPVVMGISDHVTVLDYGQKIAAGTPSEIVGNPQVIEAYLGRRRWRADAQS